MFKLGLYLQFTLSLKAIVCEAPYSAGSANGSTSTMICDTSPRDLKEAKPSVNVLSLAIEDLSWWLLVMVQNLRLERIL
jgi:hypothetical protein